MTQDIAGLCERLRGDDYLDTPFSLLEEAASTIERLQAELDGTHLQIKSLTKQLETHKNSANVHVFLPLLARTDCRDNSYEEYGRALAASLDERDTLKDRVAELEEALKPFADAYESLFVGMIPSPTGKPPMGVTLSDLEAARNALEQKA